ncbi:MAG: rhamnulokinase, partial [Alistipes sp.]|nr:rhamnulokinase [Alistipes sp.]
MSALYFLSVDLGATSGRVMLGRFDGNRVALESLHRFATPLVRIGDRYYWNIYSLYEELLAGFAIAGSRQLPIVSIGIDTWGVDMAFVGRDGALAGLPRSYRDPYTHGVPEEFFAERMPRREVYDRTGIQMLAFNSLFQLFALQKEGCSALETAQRLLFMPDALAYLLTGEMVTEYTIFSTSQCMNALSRQPDAALLQAVGVSPSLFSRAVMPGERVGLLTRSIGQATGLGQIPVVAVAGHDTASAVATVPARDAHFAYLSSGTWSL